MSFVPRGKAISGTLLAYTGTTFSMGSPLSRKSRRAPPSSCADESDPARGLPYLVAERSGRVLGYCYAAPYRSRSAYRFTLEDSIYIDAGEARRGVGRALVGLIERCRSSATGRWWRDRRQRPLALDRLARALGFSRVGVLPAVGFKFGGWIDIVLMQRPLGSGAMTLPADEGHSNGE